MKRIQICITFMVVIGLIFLSGIWISSIKQSGAEDTVLPVRAELTVYTDGDPVVMEAIAKAYERDTLVKVHMIPMPTKQIAVRLALPEGEQQGDLVLTGDSNLQRGIEHGAFQEIPTELINQVIPPLQGANQQWMGIWYDPIIIAEHTNFYMQEGKYVNTWYSLAYAGPWHIVITDFVADEAAFTILNTLGAVYGPEGAISYFDALRLRVVQYTKAMPTSVRLAAVGDVQIGIGRYSDAKQYEMHRYPLVILYPREGTPYYMMGVGMLKGSSNGEESRAFMAWLLSQRLQAILKQQDVYYLPATIPLKEQVDRQGNHLTLWKGGVPIAEQEQLLQEWIRQVRFRKDI